MRSVEYALKMGKEIYVLAHRIGESAATNALLQEGRAKAIYDLDAFVQMVCVGKEAVQERTGDAFLEYCKSSPYYEEALKKFPTRLFEAELSGEIVIKNAKVYLS
jgi:DNA processing protein